MNYLREGEEEEGTLGGDQRERREMEKAEKEEKCPVCGVGIIRNGVCTNSNCPSRKR